MGPYPHDAPAARITAENPAGTDGFGFVEYAHPEPGKLHGLFKTMGFEPVARHRGKAMSCCFIPAGTAFLVGTTTVYSSAPARALRWPIGLPCERSRWSAPTTPAATSASSCRVWSR